MKITIGNRTYTFSGIWTLLFLAASVYFGLTTKALFPRLEHLLFCMASGFAVMVTVFAAIAAIIYSRE